MNPAASNEDVSRLTTAGVACGCGQVNPPDRRFCGQCGAGLWESCPRCNVAQPRHERFCGQCGTDVRTLRDEQQNWANEQIVAAHQLTAECRFFDAARVIREVIAKLEGSSSPLIDTCRKLLPTITETRTRMMAAATTAYEQARQLSVNHDYKQAVKVLETIPELLREESMINLLDDMRSRATEVSQLKQSIRELVAARDYGTAIGRIERLLKLKPDHEEARQLANQLATKLEQAARQKHAARELSAAAQILKQIPTGFRNSEQNALLSQLNESLWLLAQVLHGPVATEGLVRVCERLAKLIGDDEKLRRLREELKRRVASDREAASGGHPSEWRGKAPTTLGGLTCRRPRWDTAERLQVEDAVVRTQFIKHQQRLGVATGLALQALELTDIQVNLVPRQKVGLLGRFAITGKRATPTTAWGIDLSPFGLKAVRLRRVSDDRVVVERVVLLTHGEAATAVVSEQEIGERLIATLQQFAKEHLTDDAKVAVNLPSLVTLGRWFTLPPAAGKRDEEMLTFELKARIALPLDDLEWDYHEFDPLSETDGKPGMRRVFAIAAKKSVVGNRLNLFNPLDIKVHVLQSEAVAWHNFLRFSQPDVAQTQALIDLGSDATNLLFSARGSFWFRSFSQGGDELTKGLAREFQVTWMQAEKMKADPAAAPSVVRWGEVVTTIKDVWSRELGLSLSQYPKELLPSGPTELQCVGGGAPLLTDWADHALAVR